MKKITIEEIKAELRDSGIKVKPSYETQTTRMVSSALKQVQKDYLKSTSRKWGTSRSFLLNRMIQTFKPTYANIDHTISYNLAQTMGGYIDKKLLPVFGDRKNIKFTAFNLNKEQVNKLNDLSDYYNISRSAVIRLIIDHNMKVE